MTKRIKVYNTENNDSYDEMIGIISHAKTGQVFAKRKDEIGWSPCEAPVFDFHHFHYSTDPVSDNVLKIIDTINKNDSVELSRSLFCTVEISEIARALARLEVDFSLKFSSDKVIISI